MEGPPITPTAFWVAGRRLSWRQNFGGLEMPTSHSWQARNGLSAAAAGSRGTYHCGITKRDGHDLDPQALYLAGFGGISEYPEGVTAGRGDVDSGPVLFVVGSAHSRRPWTLPRAHAHRMSAWNTRRARGYAAIRAGWVAGRRGHAGHGNGPCGRGAVSRKRAVNTLVTMAVALLVERVGGWLLAGTDLMDHLVSTPDAWAVLPLTYMALRFVVVALGPPLVVVALASLLAEGGWSKASQETP